MAANTPPEIHIHILSFLAHWMPESGSSHTLIQIWRDDRWISTRRSRREFVQASKRELGQLALVSRLWASACQPMIFKYIRLRCKDDLYQLLALLDAPGCQIARWATALHFAQKGVREPWLHLFAALRLWTRLPGISQSVEADLDAAFPASRPVRALHAALPRSTPFFSAHIRRLALRSADVGCLGNLMRLVAGVPALQAFSGERLAWAVREPEVLPSRLLGPAYLGHVHLKECTGPSAVVWLLAGLLPVRPGRGRPRRVAPDDLSAMGAMLQVVEAGVDGDGAKHPALEATANLLSRAPDVQVLDVHYSSRDAQGALRAVCPQVSFRIVTLSTTAHEQQTAGLGVQQRPLDAFVESVGVTFPNDGAMRGDAAGADTSALPANSLQYDWGAFDKHVSSLARLSEVVLACYTQADVDLVERAVGQAMPETRGADAATGKLRYARYVKEKRTWAHAAPSPEDGVDAQTAGESDIVFVSSPPLTFYRKRRPRVLR